MDLERISVNSTWGAESSKLNKNFDSIKNEVEQLDETLVKDKGNYGSLEELLEVYPTAPTGSKAYINTDRGWNLYIADSSGLWVDQGVVGGSAVAKYVDFDPTSSDMVSENVQDALEEVNTKTVTVAESVTEIEKELWPLEVSLSANPSLVDFTTLPRPSALSYSIKRKGELVVPQTATLVKYADTDPQESTITTASGTDTIEISSLGITKVRLYAEIGSGKLTLNGTTTVSINAVLPIYCGFGGGYTGIYKTENKLSVRTSAVGAYTGTCQSNGLYYMILVPSSFPLLNNFTMGGAPFVMNRQEVELAEGRYNLYTSGSVFAKGSEVNIKAS